MKPTLLFTILLASITALGQDYEYVPFPTEGAVWRVDQFSTTNCGGFPGLCLVPEFVVLGDTMLNGNLYHRMYRQFGMQTSPIATFREDTVERRIYALSVCRPEFECLVYDFSLEVGDTSYTPSRLGGSPDFFHTVGSIDTITMLDGSVRKKFNLMDYGVFNGGAHWIEGIGSNAGPFQHYNFLEQWNELRCVTVDEELVFSDPPIPDILIYYPEYEYCDTTILGMQQHIITEFKTHPNPATDIVKVQLNGPINEPYAIRVIDSAGRIQLYYDGIMTIEFQVNIGNLNSGFYYLTNTLNNQSTKILKL